MLCVVKLVLAAWGVACAARTCSCTCLGLKPSRADTYTAMVLFEQGVYYRLYGCRRLVVCVCLGLHPACSSPSLWLVRFFGLVVFEMIPKVSILLVSYHIPYTYVYGSFLTVVICKAHKFR